VSTRKVADEASHGYLSTLEQLVGQVAERWGNPEAPVRLRGTARQLDAALLQVQSASRPLVRSPFGIRGQDGDNVLGLLGTATRHADVLAAAADIDIDLAPDLRDRVEQIAEVLTGSLHALDHRITTGEPGGTWVRTSPMIHELESALRAPVGPRADRLRVALRELAALDEALAALAANRGLTATIVAFAPAATAPGHDASPATEATETGAGVLRVESSRTAV
jgi:hypothetical protein